MKNLLLMIVAVTMLFGCSTKTEEVKETKLEKVLQIHQVVLFPNPTQNSNNGMVTAITYFVPVAVICKNIQGADVSIPYSINSASSMIQTQLATADLAAGIYTLDFVSASGEHVSARLIK
jgi:hypothetical protein